MLKEIWSLFFRSGYVCQCCGEPVDSRYEIRCKTCEDEFVEIQRQAIK